MPALVIATGNPGKLAEIRELLRDSGWQVRAQTELGIGSVPETGTTFVENAIIKARHAAAQSGGVALADDSGLEVDALGGAPGVYSARFAGAEASDTDNVVRLLDELKDVADEARTARFRCVLALMRHGEDPAPVICEGVWNGRIAHAPRGDAGFGYDPVFIPDDSTLTSAELAPAEKNRVSHRARALHLLRDALADLKGVPSPS